MANLWKNIRMRPIHHPRIEDVVLSDLLHALADPIRIKIFQALNEVPEISCGGAAKHHGAPQSSIPKATLSRHFNLMREAGLVQSVRMESQPGTASVGQNWTRDSLGSLTLS